MEALNDGYYHRGQKNGLAAGLPVRGWAQNGCRLSQRKTLPNAVEGKPG